MSRRPARRPLSLAAALIALLLVTPVAADVSAVSAVPARPPPARSSASGSTSGELGVGERYHPEGAYVGCADVYYPERNDADVTEDDCLADGSGAPVYSNGEDHRQTRFPEPTPVPDRAAVTAVAASGHGSSFALTEDGTLFATGRNDMGQLGLGDAGFGTNRSSFTLVPDLADVVAIAAGHSHSLALDVDGSLWTTEQNAFGQLGLGDRG